MLPADTHLLYNILYMAAINASFKQNFDVSLEGKKYVKENFK